MMGNKHTYERTLHQEWERIQLTRAPSKDEEEIYLSLIRMYWIHAGGDASWPKPKSVTDLRSIEVLGKNMDFRQGLYRDFGKEAMELGKLDKGDSC